MTCQWAELQRALQGGVPEASGDPPIMWKGRRPFGEREVRERNKKRRNKEKEV